MFYVLTLDLDSHLGSSNHHHHNHEQVAEICSYKPQIVLGISIAILVFSFLRSVTESRLQKQVRRHSFQTVFRIPLFY